MYITFERRRNGTGCYAGYLYENIVELVKVQ